MADIFLSYAREDVQVARELVRELEQHDWTVFWDRDIAVGDDFQAALEDELTKANCVVVMWSIHSSDSAWVRAEAQNGLGRHALVPIQIDGELPPLIFRHLETAQLQGFPTDHSGVSLTKFSNAVTRVLGQNNQSDSVPDNVVRDDPTLSTRLAQRVIEAMPVDDKMSLLLTVAIERKISESLVALLDGKRWLDAVTQLLVDVAKITESDWVLFNADTSQVLSSSLDQGLETQSIELARSQISRRPFRQLVVSGEDIDTDLTLKALNCAWCVTISSFESCAVLFLGPEGSPAPANVLVNGLADLEVVISRAPLAPSGQT